MITCILRSSGLYQQKDFVFKFIRRKEGIINMAMYVFKDETRLDKLLAKDAHEDNKNTRFYCPNSDCDAHMYICNLDGVSAAYFRAKKSKGHIEGCVYSSANGFNPNDHKEEDFQFEEALSNLMIQSKQQSKKEMPGEHGIGSVTLKPPRTIRQIYSMCKSYDCADNYNGKEIGQMLVDDRSIYMYPRGVFGWRIIEGKRKKPKFYDNSKLEIALVAPVNVEKYEFILTFKEEKLFKIIKNMIYINRDMVIVVAAQWDSSGVFNVFRAPVASKKQLAIIK